MNHSITPLERLINKACQYLDTVGYCCKTHNLYQNIWLLFLRWALGRNIQTMTLDITTQFLKSYGIPAGKPANLLSSRQQSIRTSIRALEDFALYGYWKRRHPLTSKASFPSIFEAEAEAFLKYREVNCGLAPQTLHHNKHH